MRQIFAALFLTTQLSFAGTMDVVVQCDPAGPVYHGQLTFPNLANDWQETNTGAIARFPVELKFNGLVYKANELMEVESVGSFNWRSNKDYLIESTAGFPMKVWGIYDHFPAAFSERTLPIPEYWGTGFSGCYVRPR